jgi:hypothetical protein
MRQTLSRFRCGGKWATAVAVQVRQGVGDHEGEVVEGEAGGPAERAGHGALLVGGPPGCVFHVIAGVVSTASWAGIPREGGQRFHGIAGTWVQVPEAGLPTA